ncbi:unnamed protein product [Prorocentrum cordatum]|uniref:Uncharacterized protein n=1 Tax=Prorocentrum cordatum TaxID=2364126 RepID=A0ABN9VFF3_9DINO|nr:unnamed protein product [Polarella glacialis]
MTSPPACTPECPGPRARSNTWKSVWRVNWTSPIRGIMTCWNCRVAFCPRSDQEVQVEDGSDPKVVPAPINLQALVDGDKVWTCSWRTSCSRAWSSTSSPRRIRSRWTREREREQLLQAGFKDLAKKLLGEAAVGFRQAREEHRSHRGRLPKKTRKTDGGAVPGAQDGREAGDAGGGETAQAAATSEAGGGAPASSTHPGVGEQNPSVPASGAGPERKDRLRRALAPPACP